MLIIFSIVQKKIARYILTTLTTLTLKILCISVKREEESKVLEEKILMKTRVLKQNKIREHFGMLREVERREFLSSPKCCYDGKISATKRCGRASVTRVCVYVFRGTRHTGFGGVYMLQDISLGH